MPTFSESWSPVRSFRQIIAGTEVRPSPPSPYRGCFASRPDPRATMRGTHSLFALRGAENVAARAWFRVPAFGLAPAHCAPRWSSLRSKCSDRHHHGAFCFCLWLPVVLRSPSSWCFCSRSCACRSFCDRYHHGGFFWVIGLLSAFFETVLGQVCSQMVPFLLRLV